MNAKPRESKPILKLTPKAANEGKKVCVDDGYTKIPNALLDAILESDLTKPQMKLVIGVLRKTLSWHKEKDWICNEQLAEICRFCDDKEASRIKNELLRIGVLLKDGRKIGINLTVSEWKNKIQRKHNIVEKEVKNPINLQQKSNKSTTTKETITKENINITPLPPTGASVQSVEETQSPAKRKPVDYDGVMEAWNEVFAETPIAKLRVMSDERKRQVHRLAKNLYTQFGDYSVKAFRDYFEDFWQQVASQSNSWYLGNNQRKWVADFDYLMKPKTFAKTVEESL